MRMLWGYNDQGALSASDWWYAPRLGDGVDSMRDILSEIQEFYWPIKNSDKPAR